MTASAFPAPVAIDFETFYAPGYDVRSLGLARYLHDRSFDCYLVAIVGGDIPPFVGHPQDAPWFALHGRTLVAHHAAFDRAVFERLQEFGVIPAGVQPAAWHCTADLAAFLQSPRALDSAARELLGTIIDKSVRDALRGVNWLQAKFILGDDTVLAYALRDAEACLHLWLDFSKHWPEPERRLSQLTRAHAAHGVFLDTDEISRGLAKLAAVCVSAERQLPWVGRAPPTSRKALAAECRLHGIPPPPSTSEDDPACDEWEERWGLRFPWITAIRTWRKANRLRRVLETMRDRARPDGTLRTELKYFGATATGRWSGASGINLQNFNREAFEGVDARCCLRARPGHRLVLADLSQIEPRCLAWLSGDADLLDRLRAGAPLYEAHARATMGWTGGALKKEDPRLYLLAANAKIVALWQCLEQAMLARVGGVFFMRLPSGRVLRYFDVRRDESCRLTAATERGGHSVTWYGGKLVENLVQATARDVFAEGLLRIADAGIHILWTVHDEVICEVPEDSTVTADTVCGLLAQTPSWMPGLPVAAEGREATAYGK